MTSPRRRDAAATRLLLMEAARRRFAYDGYAATTVRDIADDAGVNVALINRYFVSKEGLFEACLSTSVGEPRPEDGDTTLDRVQRTMARRVAGTTAEDDPERLKLMMLLRTSGDERAEELRRQALTRISTRLAEATSAGGDALLRAQLLIAASLGITLLRSTTRLEPLASATEDDLAAPLSDLISALLAGPAGR